MWESFLPYPVLCLLFLFSYLQVTSSLSLNSSSQSRKLCSSEESFALLNFKNSISINSSLKFPSLTHLNLSYSHFSGLVPREISRLSKLVSLDLSIDYYSVGELELEGPVMEELVQNMTEFKELILDCVNMSSVQFRSMTNISSLTSLSLSNCELCGSFSGNIFRLSDLRMIILDENSALTGIFPKVN
ncbi:hypothetical protein JRO89_XS15G0174900 [Xanthoceras sorbifolium]|uniref:Uncharacterized protein n=1 Tax=Xanthoceras sorbifolium TaxID=99658 RepID=A0ABQ8H2R0_9ROSI|nr:hypothetical protein JRO89_XS15G0174900 [Xanthoceras sorbifolium]